MIVIIETDDSDIEKIYTLNDSLNVFTEVHKTVGVSSFLRNVGTAVVNVIVL